MDDVSIEASSLIMLDSFVRRYIVSCKICKDKGYAACRKIEIVLHIVERLKGALSLLPLLLLLLHILDAKFLADGLGNVSLDVHLVWLARLGGLLPHIAPA